MPATETGTLFVSFWKITLDNLPEGIFSHRRITPGEAKRCIDQARTNNALTCLSAEDLLAPYRQREEDNHKALCLALEEHFEITLRLHDFMTAPDDEGVFFTNPLDFIEVTDNDRLLVVTCMYVLPDQKKSSWSLPDLEIDPSSVEFHLFEAARPRDSRRTE